MKWLSILEGRNTAPANRHRSHYSFEITFIAIGKKEERVQKQMTEAVADYNATATVVKYIKDKYRDPAAQKNAALDVLKGWPPSLLNDEAKEVMSRVASKMLNEQRVFRVMLANPEFRRMVGCEFQAETPGYCNGTNANPSGHKPATRKPDPSPTTE